MGFSFSGLSLVTTATAELGAGDVVPNGARSGSKGPKLLLSSGEPLREEEGGPTDSESGVPLAAVCVCADGKPSHLKDAPSQANLFSSLWTSAAGLSGPESAGAGLDSFSILSSEELFSARDVFLERPPAAHAATQEAGAVAAGDLLGSGTGRQRLVGLPGILAKENALAASLDAGVPKQLVAAGSAAALRIAAAAEISQSAAANSESTEDAEGRSEKLAALHNATATSAEARANKKSAVPRTAFPGQSELLTERPGAGRGKVPADSPTRDARRPSGPETRVQESTNPTDTIPASPGANPFAVLAGAGNAKSVAPHDAASSSAAQQQGPPATPPGVSTASVTPEGNAALPQQSEIAFQAELRLNNQPGAADAPYLNPQRGAVGRWAVPAPREGAAANSGGALQTESEAPAEPQAGATVLSRKESEQPEAGGSFAGQSHAGGHSDHGANQTAPLSHGPFVMDAKSAAAGALTSKPQAVPAAAHLDSAAPVEAPETGRTAHSVALKIQSENHGAAHVVLTDRGSQVHVTVRSSDPTLAHSLRGDLGSLAGGLQQQGFDVRFVPTTPGSSMNPGTRADSGEFSSQDDYRGQTRHHHSSADADQRNRRHTEWTEEFD